MRSFTLVGSKLIIYKKVVSVYFMLANNFVMWFIQYTHSNILKDELEGDINTTPKSKQQKFSQEGVKTTL